MNELDLFTAALGIQDSQARAAYLDEHCQGNTPVRQRLEELLKAYRQADEVLPVVPVIDPNVTEMFTGQKKDQLIGTMIAGKYKLLEEIGEGGMGTVFVAEQTEPVKRKVAVKLIKAGMDSKSVLARFEAERQALAMMDHPNIAKVLDAGLTEERRPYFVMEYIKGLPLTKYCDDVKLSIDERLKLFIQICQAVQHAHQKGIIHRDLKPTNILIALYDGKPVPKVIDFGLAKALHQSLTERTLHTGHEMVLGTPLYMSPEQAELNNLDIDTRSDIYSLGVILYELLTGVTPLEKQRFKEAAWAEVLRIIKEEEPSKPSTKLSHSESLPSVAAQRQVEPKKLSSLMKGDLDWIVMKALEKDRNRRYETANGFAADVLRYLSGEAVTAVPPSTGYRLRKFVKRNKGKVVAAGLVAAAMLLGIIGTTLGLFEAKRQEHLASERAEGERLAKLDAVAQKEQAEKRLTQIGKANDILGSVFVGLDPKADYATVAELRNALKDNLTKAVKELDGTAIGEPLVVAEMQNKLGESLLALGEADLAIDVFGKSLAIRKERLGTDHRDTLESMSNLAMGYQSVGKMDRALPLNEETFQLCTTKLGADDSLTLTVMGNLVQSYYKIGKWDKAVALCEETFKLSSAKWGADHYVTLRSMNDLAHGYQAVGKSDKALSLNEETLRLCAAKLGADHPDTLTAMGHLANRYLDAGKLDLALPLLEETVKLKKAKLGPEHPTTLLTMGNLAEHYRTAGKLDLALPLLEETLKLMKAKLGPEHPTTLTTMGNLALGYKAAGKLNLALPLLEETFNLKKAKLGPEHPSTLLSMGNLAEGYRSANKLSLALPLLEETFNLQKAKLGPEHLTTLTTMGNLALGYLDAGKLDLALPLLVETVKLKKAKLGPEHPTTLTTMGNLARGYKAVGKLDLALPLFEETHKLMKSKLGSEHPDTLNSMNNLAAAYWSRNRFDKSIPLFEEMLPIQEKKLGRQHPSTQITVANLGVNYKDAGRFKEAITLLEEVYRASKKNPTLRWVGRQLLDIYLKAGETAKYKNLLPEQLTDTRKTLPKDSSQLASRLVQFGSDLLQLHQWTDAVPLLRESLAIREKTQPDAWTTFNTQSLLGGALLGQKKHADAEPLLLKGLKA